MPAEITPDHINALFEFVGSALVCLSIRRLWLDKVVRGASMWPVAFFSTWGFWNLYFYPSVDAWWSFTAGLFMVAVNSIWLLQMGFYIGRERWRLR